MYGVELQIQSRLLLGFKAALQMALSLGEFLGFIKADWKHLISNDQCKMTNEEWNQFMDRLFQFFKAAVLYQAFHLANGNVVELQQPFTLWQALMKEHGIDTFEIG